MKKKELEQKTDAIVADAKEALQTVYDTLNQGQRKKLLKNEKALKHFEHYGVEVTE